MTFLYLKRSYILVPSSFIIDFSISTKLGWWAICETDFAKSNPSGVSKYAGVEYSLRQRELECRYSASSFFVEIFF